MAKLVGMSATPKPVFERLGYATIFVAGLVLLLILRNLRSRLYYGPDYGFLFWLFVWSAIGGIGLLRLRKWAVILLFFPGLATGVVILAGVVKTSIATWVVLVNVSFAVLLLAIPVLLFRYWNELRW
jgi:hypothetical protein